uniref:Uncharacterized protein n=1 Tax=viral metagenome TaxID=1070528 RepID=A0A6M3LAB8_9ZZZZ
MGLDTTAPDIKYSLQPLDKTLNLWYMQDKCQKGGDTMSRIQELKQELHALPGDRREEIDKLLREIIEELDKGGSQRVAFSI